LTENNGVARVAEEKKCDQWVRVEIAADAELTDALANFLTEIGAEGVCQEAPAPAGDGVAEAVLYETLTAYLPGAGKEERVASLETYLDALECLFPDGHKPTFKIEEIASVDWGEEWKKYFHPLRVGKKFIIKPTWEAYLPTEGEVVIEIDPGMAFGTGQHHSTAMCLEALEDLFIRAPGAPREVLDVGTGTGILGIAAAKLGANKVVGLDIDENAVAIAIENAALNRVAERLAITNSDVFTLPGTFDLIMANLTAKLLTELHRCLTSLLAPGGSLIISGILDWQGPEIEACFSHPPLRLLRSIKGEEWLCYVFQKDEQ